MSITATPPTEVPVKGVSQWNIFLKRVRDLTELQPAKNMTFCSSLKKLKGLDVWTDAEIATACAEWKEKELSEADPVPPILETKITKSETVTKKVKESKKIETQSVPETIAPETPSLSVSQLQLQLSEARAKLTEVESTAETLESSALKAQAKADDAKTKAESAMKVAVDFQQKATIATDAASTARKKVNDCQKDIAVKTLLVEQAQQAQQTRAQAIMSEPQTGDTDSSGGGTEPLHIRRKKTPKHIKTLVWNQHIGPDIATIECVSCRKEKITNRNFHCGHIVAESRGGDMTIKNLRPICAACNGAMGTRSMNEFTQEYFGWIV